MNEHPPILLLEDDRLLRDLMVDGLQDAGYQVVALKDAGRLDAELEQRAGRAILVADRDIGPGTATGFDLAAAALDRYPALKVVYVSGTQLAVKHRTLSPRERSLLKPFAVSQLAGLVRQLG